MINRSEIEESVVGAVKRMWKQLYDEKGPIPGITELNSQNFNIC